MTSLIQTLGNRTIGSVEKVSADRITTLLESDAPQATALNAGAPFGFPRINGYVLIPNESGAIACIISSVYIQRQHLQGKRGSQQASDFVDLPFPSRLMELTPLGTLKSTSTGNAEYKVQRGVDVFPSVGAPVLLPNEEQLRAIVAGEDENQAGHVLLGHCPTANMAPVRVDPDKLFGRHLAILGNTGSGKSCSVAGLIHWSLKAAREERKDCDRPNARFIVLDPNGEYSGAFKNQEEQKGQGSQDVRVFQVGGGDQKEILRVPAWLLNGEEWVAFTKAAPGTQGPILFEALRRLRAGLGPPEEFETEVKGRVVGYKSNLKVAIKAGDHQKSGVREEVANELLNIRKDFMAFAADPRCEDKQLLQEMLNNIADSAKQIEEEKRGKSKDRGGYWHSGFSYTDIKEIVNKLQEIAEELGLSEELPATDENAPIDFPIKLLRGYIKALAADHTKRDMAQFVETLDLRIRDLLHNEVLSSVFQTQSSQSMTLEKWLTDYIGDNEAKNGTVAVVDLSLVPTEVIHIIVSVLARMIFEASQRYRRENDCSLPTTLVLEEAHTFIHQGLTSESASPASQACAKVFEKIAREGRKFGLGLVLASQSPSEIAPTVLSQCNTFLLHRLAKDRDQDLVKRLVPDSLGMLLRELPSLPTRRAILLGWATPAPTLVEIKKIPKNRRPHSPDPAFWDVWIGEEDRPIEWEPIARRWQRRTDSDNGQKEQKPQNN